MDGTASLANRDFGRVLRTKRSMAAIQLPYSPRKPESWPERTITTVGFWGVTIGKTRHRFEVDGVQLYAWCAWDTLFLPELLGKSARVDSICEATGTPVRLCISPNRVESVDPGPVCISFLAPDRSRFQQDIVQNFCHYVHFFRSRKDGEAWIAKTPGTFILSLDEATGLARRKNQLQFGSLLRGNAD